MELAQIFERHAWENDKHNLKMQFQSDQLTLGND